MDRRSWPWKRKSSDKSAAKKAAALLNSANAALQLSHDQMNMQLLQDDVKKPSYVQISVETYSHLTASEEKVKKMCEEKVRSLEEEIEELNEELSASNSEITTKENMVKQHTKVAEEAVSGWEKAEAEALALKGHLESVTLEKLAAEDRVSHLDGALKECMNQIRNQKEEHEKGLEEVVHVKTKQLEDITNEFETKIAALDQELLRSEADIAALSRSLQDRSNMVIKLSEGKSMAEAEIEILKSNINSCEREISRLKYEVHVVSKELDIRNEEKNMSVRSAEVANKLHMEGVKKILKLEAECHRLRGLVRKKLPGPAALAQMRVEVENLGRDYGDPHFKRSPVKPSSPQRFPMPEFCLDNIQKVQRENEFLTERLYEMEEETKMLKEALAMRNGELQASRSTCAKTVNQLQLMESQLLVYNASNPPSLASMSEDGNEEDRTVRGSGAASLMSERSQFKKEKNFEKLVKDNSTKHLGLMDDFLEMEKLANNPDGMIPAADGSVKNQLSEPLVLRQDSGVKQLRWVKLQSQILSVLEKTTEADNTDKVLEEIKLILQEAHDIRNHETVSSLSEERFCTDAVLLNIKAQEVSAVSESDSMATGTDQTSILDLKSSLYQIHEFVLPLGSVDSRGLGQTIEEFSATYHKFLNKDADLASLVEDLSRVFARARQLKFNFMDKGSDSEVSSPNCIDKVALPENEAFHSRNGYRNGSTNIMDLSSNPYVSDDGNTNSNYDASTSVGVLVEDHEKFRSKNEKLAEDLVISDENLESLKSQVQALEQALAETKAQLASAQKSNSLAETQLKCMAESYRSLEERAEELQREMDLLVARNECLSKGLDEEKSGHQETLDKYNNLEERLLRMESSLSQADAELKSKQEHDLSATAEKLAECQDTIFLLGKQLKALHPQTEVFPANTRSCQVFLEQAENTVSSTTAQTAGDHSYSVPSSPLESESNFMRSPARSTRNTVPHCQDRPQRSLPRGNPEGLADSSPSKGSRATVFPVNKTASPPFGTWRVVSV